MHEPLSVTGLGYVGLPVAAAFAAAGHRVTGYDHDTSHIQRLQGGQPHAGVAAPQYTGITFTSDPQARAAATAHIVTVPTPVDVTRKPDLSLLQEACLSLGAVLKHGDMVVFESTVYPGATREVCVPLLERASGLQAGRDIAVAYSPERINPGDTMHQLSDTVKVVAGLDDASTTRAARLYRAILQHPPYIATSLEVAEAAKVLENTQRDVNIALMNEMALVFGRLGLDTNAVIDAAASKWNFHAYRPGLVGGHCIGVDPYYLVHAAETRGYTPQTILAARHVNNRMGAYVAGRVIRWLLKNRPGAPVVTILGLTFKENIDDVRNSRVADIIHDLEDSGVTVQVHDTCADPDTAYQQLGVTLRPFEQLQPADAVVLAVAHDDYRQKGWPLMQSCLKQQQGLVADIKGVLPQKQCPEHIDLWRL